MFSTEAFIIFICLFVLFTAIFWALFFIYKKLKHIQKTLEELKIPIANIDHELQVNLLEEKRTHILMMLYRMREAVAKQQDELRPHYIEELPTSHGLSGDELSRLFPNEAALLIDQCFFKYRDYVEKHWMTKHHQTKTIFQGIKDNPQSERGQLHFESKKLVSFLDQMITKLNSLT